MLTPSGTDAFFGLALAPPSLRRLTPRLAARARLGARNFCGLLLLLSCSPIGLPHRGRRPRLPRCPHHPTPTSTPVRHLFPPYTSGRLVAPNTVQLPLQDVCPQDSRSTFRRLRSRPRQLMLNALDPPTRSAALPLVHPIRRSLTRPRLGLTATAAPTCYGDPELALPPALTRHHRHRARRRIRRRIRLLTPRATSHTSPSEAKPTAAATADDQDADSPRHPHYQPPPDHRLRQSRTDHRATLIGASLDSLALCVGAVGLDSRIAACYVFRWAKGPAPGRGSVDFARARSSPVLTSALTTLSSSGAALR